MSNGVLWLVGIIFFVVLPILKRLFAKKPGQAGEENTLRLIRQFIKQKGWKKTDYLLVSNLILQRESYWSCEIDILLLTRKWIYIIEVKDWGRGRLTGNLNDEYLEWSYPVGRQRWHERHRMYSPFYQNEKHVKRFKDYFQLNNNQHILSVICFNSPYLGINLRENQKTIFENKHLWISNGYHEDIVNLLGYWENKGNNLPYFEKLKEKISQEISTPNKIQRHQNWVKLVKERKSSYYE